MLRPGLRTSESVAGAARRALGGPPASLSGPWLTRTSRPRRRPLCQSRWPCGPWHLYYWPLRLLLAGELEAANRGLGRTFELRPGLRDKTQVWSDRRWDARHSNQLASETEEAS